MNEEFIKREKINPDIELKEDEGEVICSECNGWGVRFAVDENVVATCGYCHGAGKMDWLDNATGGLEYGYYKCSPRSRKGKQYPIARVRKYSID